MDLNKQIKKENIKPHSKSPKIYYCLNMWKVSYFSNFLKADITVLSGLGLPRLSPCYIRKKLLKKKFAPNLNYIEIEVPRKLHRG